MTSHEQTIRHFSRAVLSCASVLPHIKDGFLARSLEDAVLNCIEAGMRPDAGGRLLFDAASELHRCLEDTGMTQAAPLRALLLAERHVLLLMLHLRSSHQTGRTAHQVPRAEVERTSHQRSENSVSRSILTNGRITDTMKQVLEGIKKTQPARAKEIIEFCGALSERTVKRNLTELVRAGLASKVVENGSVLYSAPSVDSA